MPPQSKNVIHERITLIIIFSALCLFFTSWFAIPFSLSRSQDARMARAFITDEADLCEIITQSINENKAFMFDAYGFIYYKSGIYALRKIKNHIKIDESTVLIFFRLYSWLYFIGIVLILTILAYQLTGFYAALFTLVFAFVVSPNLLLYSAMLHPDVAQVFFISLSLWLLYLFVSREKIRYLLVSSISAALAFSCKYSGLLLLPAIYMAILFANALAHFAGIKKYFYNFISLVLLWLTYYLFDNEAIAIHISGASVKEEILLYIKLVKHFSVIVSLLIIIESIIYIKKQKPEFVESVENIVFLVLSTSWLFLGTYLLTVRNLLPDYQFLASFLNVTGFHAMGHNFIEEGGVINWIELMLRTDIFGYVLIPVFLLSIIIIALKYKKLERNLKLTFVFFAIWQCLFVASVMFRVKSMWGHFLLPMVPVLIVFSSFLFHQIFEAKKKIVSYAVILLFLILITERGIEVGNYCLEKKSEEINSISIEAGNWLSENADVTCIISANNYCYVPKVFKNVNFNWGTNLEDLYSENIDYILTHTNVLDDYTDSSLADKYKFGSDAYLNRHWLREQLLRNNNGKFELIKDFDAVKIFKRISSPQRDTLFFSLCTFEAFDKYWNIDKNGIDSTFSTGGNKIWHFTKDNIWGPTFYFNLNEGPKNEAYLIEIKIKLFAQNKMPNALIISQLNNGEEIVKWQKTGIISQMNKSDEWVQLHANLIISKELKNKNELKFSAYLWNLENNDFYIDDFEIIFSRL